jgi:hypothetical protein
MEKQSVNLQLDEKNSSAKVSVPIAYARIKGWSDKEKLTWKEEDGKLILEEADS